MSETIVVLSCFALGFVLGALAVLAYLDRPR